LWISHIRLSDKTSRLHPRHVVPKPAQAYELEMTPNRTRFLRSWSISRIASATGRTSGTR